MVFKSKIIEISIYISIFIITYFGIEYYRRYSLKKNILDIPNQRSSHKKPTPRGGGLVFVLVTLISFGLYQIFDRSELYWSFYLGGLLVSGISFIDDLYTISIKWRIVFHILAAVLIVWQFGHWEMVYIPVVGIIDLSIFGFFVSVLWIVWIINAFNFMDGIDGIAAVQGITASIGWFIAGLYLNANSIVFLSLTLLFTNLAFIKHNWPPAKIFMGDVGSAFLGYTFAAIPFLFLKNAQPINFSAYVPMLACLFLWLFVFDTVLTFIKRVLKKEKVWQAHRQHLYQSLVISGYSHIAVSLMYGIFSLIITLSAIYNIFIIKSEIVLISLTLMVTITLVLIVYCEKSLTKAV